MRVFLSFSGDRSRAIATALNNWLPTVLQSVEPFLSQNIEKGSRWALRLAEELETANFGICCLTPENLTNPWILFEAGALSKKLGSRFCPYLFGLTNGDLEEPLGQFQNATATKDETLQLLKDINTAAGERMIPEKRVEDAFEALWSKLEDKLRDIPRPVSPSSPPARKDRELIEEVLSILREQQRERTSDRDRVVRTTNLQAQLAALTGPTLPAHVRSAALEILAPGAGNPPAFSASAFQEAQRYAEAVARDPQLLKAAETLNAARARMGEIARDPALSKAAEAAAKAVRDLENALAHSTLARGGPKKKR